MEEKLLKAEKKAGAKVGLMSRIDYGGSGFRQALVNLGFEIFKKEKVDYIILAGGLVSHKSLKLKMPKDKEERKIFLEKIANDLAKIIPSVKKDNGEPVRIYIITSPVPNYDGEIGEWVAKKLTELRDDIRYWGESTKSLVKQVQKIIWVLTPTKTPWRSEFYSTPAERIIKDKIKQTPQDLPDLFVVGCLASSILKPQGEFPRPYVTVPASCRIEEINTSENQIGVSILIFPGKNENFRVKVYNFKDLVARERYFIDIPQELSPAQKKIIEAFQAHGPLTIGMIADFLDNGSRDDALKEVKALQKTKGIIPINYDRISQRYDFSLLWMQKKLQYKWPEKDWQMETLVAFGCLHAGSVHVGYNFFLRELPEIIIKRGAKILVGAGDFIEGLNHNLLEKGEVYGGLNGTQQERLAAYVVGSVILKVFEARIKSSLQSSDGNKPSPEILKQYLSDSLLDFIYISGNHDQWQGALGFTPLAIFRLELLRFVEYGIENFFANSGLHYTGLRKLVEEKIRERNKDNFPSGVSIEEFHPHMARAKTTSLRPQEMLNKSSCQIVIGANFHVAECLTEWNSKLGQRVVMEVGTMVTETDFEEQKLKTVDFVVGFLQSGIVGGKILTVESAFYGKDPKEPDRKDKSSAEIAEMELSNEQILDDLLKKLGIKIPGNKN